MASALLSDASRGALAVSSAGLLYDGRPASEPAVEWARASGLDLSAHRSRTITRAIVDEADLILAMEPRHVREVVAVSEATWQRTFALRELVQRGETAGARARDESLSDWLLRVSDGRERRELLRDPAEWIVADPYGASAATYERTGEVLHGLLEDLMNLAWGFGFA